MSALFAPEHFADAGGGPLYLQLKARIAAAIEAGTLRPGQSLPPERDMAQLTGLSRVTVRKAVQELVEARWLVQRRGSGTFVAPRIERVEQALSRLTSFSEDMARRGKTVRSHWLSRAVHARLARGDDGAGADRARRGGAAGAAAHRRRDAAGDRAGVAADRDPARSRGGGGLALRRCSPSAG